MLIRLFIFIFSLSTIYGQNVLLNKKYDKKKKTQLTLTTLNSQLPPTGYAVIRVQVRNDEKSTVTWKFTFNHTEFNYYSGSSSDFESELSSTNSVTCEAGKEKTADLLVPLLSQFSDPGKSNSSSTLAINIQAGALGGDYCKIDSQYQANWPSVLISDTLYLPEKTNLDSYVNSSGYRSGAEFGSMFNPKKMSFDWQAYIGFDHIMMSDKDWLDIDPSARSAILAAVRLGTNLAIHTASDSTFGNLQIKTNNPEARKTFHGAGEISLIPWKSANGFLSRRLVDKLRNQYAARTRSHLLGTLSSNRTPPLQNLLGEKNFNITLVVLVLIVFGILVGPINLFVFAKSGQRHKLFITTPVISIAASLLLLVVILFQDGLGGNGHRIAIMQVYPGENENAAYLTQHQFCRTGVLLGTDFETEDDTWLSPAVIPQSRWARVHPQNLGGGSRYNVQKKESQIAHSGDWFQSRSELAHHALGVLSTRGRIEVKKQTSPPVVQSTFDFPIKDFFYIAQDGSKWMAQEIGKGQETTLQPATDAQYLQWMIDIRKKLPRSMKTNFENITKRPDHYYAITHEGPAIETYGAIKWISNTAIVTGPIFRP